MQGCSCYGVTCAILYVLWHFYAFITVPLICTQCTVYAVNITKLLTLIASIRVKNIGSPKPGHVDVYSDLRQHFVHFLIAFIQWSLE